MNRGRSKPLSVDQQRAVAEYAINHPEESHTLVALRMGCNTNQVKYALRRVAEGVLVVRRDQISDRLKSQAIADTTSEETMAENQCRMILAQLEANPYIKLSERAAVMRTYSLTRRILQEVRMEAHMSRTDAAILCAIIRRFIPHATDEECITIYHEEVSRWKATRA